ncbi:MAG: GFA family protein [Planctomycetes bacterium]|nr:GFA family protein [Planctomycetota bacterium]
MKKKLTGRCSCGGVKFEVQLPAKFVAHCHCNNCRRAHGAGFVTWAGFKDEQFVLISGRETLNEYATETDATRGFCGECGSPMFFSSPRWAGEIHVAVAVIDGDLEQLPTACVYADRAPNWCPAPADLPHRGGESGVEPIA